MTLQELMTRWNGYQIEMRRWFHQHPEESTKEVRTAERIRAELDRAGIPWRPCGLGTGTLARIEGAQPGRTILLRGDIDALSAAMIVNEIRDRLKGTIVFAFQPAEELGLGARAMIEEGALEGVDACFGMHVWSDYPAGTVALRKGPMMASGDQFKIHVRGKSTHGAQPQLGADALIMGAAIAQNLQTIVSRETYPGDTAVVTVGKFHSGTRFNVVAGTAELEGTTRTFSPAVRDRFEEQITRIARSTAEAMRGTADVEYLRIVPVTVNDPGMIDVVTGAAGKIFGDKGVIEADLQMGGEDFAFYQEKVPGAMVLLGVRNEACDAVWPQHHGCYKVDESVLVKGAALHVQTALDFLGVDLQ